MPFLLDGNPEPSEISEAINYLLANVGAGNPVGTDVVYNDTTTGFISNGVGDIIQYQYRYLDIKYADDRTGLNFSDNPYGRLFFGIYNSDTTTESTNPADYTWFQVTDGFGINKVLWIATTGGRHVTYAVSQDAPDNNQNWQVAPIQAIDLDNPFKVYNQYMTVRFSTNSIGAGFSESPTNAKFYGIYTSSDGSVSSDPTEYAWSPFDFGTTYQLYYRVLGGRNITFQPSTYQPLGYIPFTNLTINLDVQTNGAASQFAIVSQNPFVIQVPFRYILVQYADDAEGTGMSSDPAGKFYFGIQVSDVIAIDTNPADYSWFSAGGQFLVDVNLWSRNSANNVVQFSLTLDAPDGTGWFNVTGITSTPDPYIDVYARTGTVVTNISSPTDGRIGYSYVGNNGIVNLNLDPYGQGANTSGFEIDITTTATVAVDQYGRVYQTGALDQVRYSVLITSATSGQTAFTFSNSQADQIMVFRNGLFLKPGTDYTRTSTTVTLTDACTSGDRIQMYYIRLISGSTSADLVPFVTYSQTLTSGQTNIETTYQNGSELLFINGVLIVDTDYSYIGTDQGYILSNPSTGGDCCIVVFARNNGNQFIFSENYSETSAGSTNVIFPTYFYRNSSLIWLNGCLMRPGTDYTIPGAATTSYNYTSSGFLSYSGQPTQFCSFNSAGEASTSSISAAGVLGMDMPVVIEQKKSIKDMFMEMQQQIDYLKAKLERFEE